MMYIDNGAGDGGYQVKVNSNHEMLTLAEAESIQHRQSIRDKRAFQVLGTTNLASGTVVAMHCTNDDLERNMVVTYIRHQIVGASGGTAFPNSSNYFQIALNGSYSSGGSAVTPVNLYRGSGNQSSVTCYVSNPTLTGSIDVIDRWYTKADGDMNVFNKEGSVIIPPNQSICLRYIGDHTSGIIYTRLSFIMKTEA